MERTSHEVMGTCRIAGAEIKLTNQRPPMRTGQPVPRDLGAASRFLWAGTFSGCGAKRTLTLRRLDQKGSVETDWA